MKKKQSLIAVIASVVSAAALITAALIVCKKLFDKKYITVID